MEKRFGEASFQVIDSVVDNHLTPKNTAKSRISIWKQFRAFCKERNYELLESTPLTEMAHILKDWAFNMKKANGDDYKEGVIKTMWNITSKKLQEMYYKNYGIAFDPFTDIIFKEARDARNAKRKQLQRIPEKRKMTSTVLSREELFAMMRIWDENTPLGLQRKFFHVASYELGWTCREAANCLLHYFCNEVRNDGSLTGRVEYNPTFSKTVLGGSQLLTYNCQSSKWLNPNSQFPDVCPVRLLKKILGKRSKRIETDRVFLTVNPYWNQDKSHWYKNMGVGRNEMAKWTKIAAEKIGLDTKRIRIMSSAKRDKNDGASKAGLDDQLLVLMGSQSGCSTQLGRHLPRLLPKPPEGAAAERNNLQKFQLKEDMDNYLEFSMMNKAFLRLKSGVVPHIFVCQPDKKVSAKKVPLAAARRAQKRKVSELLESSTMVRIRI